MQSLRDDLREQAVQLDVQDLVVHHPGEIHVLKRGVHAQDCIARFKERTRSRYPRPEPEPPPYDVHAKNL